MSRGVQDPHGPIYILTVRVNKMSGMTKSVYILTGECASDRHRVKPRIASARHCDKKVVSQATVQSFCPSCERK